MRISDWSSDVCSSDLTSAPMATKSPWYVLMEFSAGGSAAGADGGRLRAVAEEILAASFEADRITDAVLAASEGQARQLWRSEGRPGGTEGGWTGRSW